MSFEECRVEARFRKIQGAISPSCGRTGVGVASVSDGQKGQCNIPSPMIYRFCDTHGAMITRARGTGIEPILSMVLGT